MSPVLAKFFKTPELIPILCVLGFSFWLTSCGITHSSLLYREMRFRSLAAADLCAALAAYLVALTFAYRGFGVWSLVFANIANSVTSVTGYWIAARWRPALEFATEEIKSVARYSLNLSGFGIVNYFSRNADNITVGKILGQAALGDYQMAYNLMLTPIQNISSVIAQATFPAFARIQDDDARFRLAYTRSCMLIGLISFPVLAGMGVVADPMIRTVLGPKWIGAIRVFQILAPVGLVQSIYTTIGQIYMSKARTDWMFRWGVAQTVILVSSFLIGVPYRQDTRVGRTTCVHCGKISPPFGHINTFDEKKIERLFAGARICSIDYLASTRERTNFLSTWLQDFARNPYGTYEQEEPCIHCGGKLTAPVNRPFSRRLAGALGLRLYKAQYVLNRPRPTWMLVRLQKNAGEKSST